MANDPINKNLGTVTAYGYAKSKGYTGTEEDFAELMADYATVGQQAAASAQEAAASAQGAQAAKNAAESAASSAEASESDAASSASAAASAAQEAAGSAAAASTAQQGAAAAQEAAVSAQGAAEQAATDAGSAKDAAKTAQQSAEDAKVGAVTAQGQAEQAASSAQASAQEAHDYAEAYYALLPTDEASGAIASFDDGAGGVPVKDLTVQIAPVQSGTGDPSPDDVRPLSGWLGASIQCTGKNLFDKDNFVSFNGYIPTAQTGTFVGSGSGRNVIYFRCKPGQAYTASRPRTTTNERFGICFSKEPPASGVPYFNASLINASGVVGDIMVLTATAPADAVYVCVWDGWANSVNPRDSLQIEVGAAASAYEPYKGNTYPISWESEAGTVYGGTLDVTTGLLTVRPYYASYAGETLTGPWVSSMDVYAQGTTPTTGAQVVDLGGMPSTYQLSPTEVTTLLGVNNIWADTGDSAVSYRADVALYIDKKLGVSG